MWDLQCLQETRAQDLTREAEHQRIVQAVIRKPIVLSVQPSDRQPGSTLLWRALFVLRLAFGME